MSVPIELRVGEEDGAKLIRSIYGDLVSLPDPLRLGLTVRIFNYDDVGLYMRVDGYNAAWTFTSNNLGLLASGANLYNNLDQFGSRAKPAAQTLETITVRLRAYTDAGYTILKWTFERVIDVVLIKSDDGTWTQDFLNNFDDGTVQGWTTDADGTEDWITGAVATDYVLSAPYSHKATKRIIGYSAAQRSKSYKTFNTPNRATVYAIVDFRISTNVVYGAGVQNRVKYLTINNGGTILVFLGRPHDGADADYLPKNKWMRIVVPLPPNTAVDFRIYLDSMHLSGDLYGESNHFGWMDDFRIISK